jgi:regulator of RNase E activity RraA
MRLRPQLWLALAAACPLWAQFSGFSAQELIKYTPLNPFERLPDGRPRVPDALLKRLEQATCTEAWTFLARVSKYRDQFTGGWQILQPEKRLIGRAFTVQYMPVRPEMSSIIERETEARLGRKTQMNQRVLDMLKPGDVLVADLYGKVEGGSFVGDNLAAYIRQATGAGFVINGGIRDIDPISRLGIPGYHRGGSPTVYTDMMLTGVNVPVRIGDVTVMPGDVVLGDREGVTFIPPHLAGALADFSEEQQLHDEWVQAKMRTGKFTSTDLYPMPRDPALKKEYEDWLKRKKAERGLK